MIISGDVSKEDLTEINELLAVEVGQLFFHSKTIGLVLQHNVSIWNSFKGTVSIIL